MAKAKNLAGLAALGALGYMLTRDKPSENAGDQKTSSYTGDTKKVEALEDAFIPTNESSYARNNTGTPMQGVGDATDNPLPKQRIKPLATADSDSLSVKTPTSGNSADKLASLSRSKVREAKAKQFAQDVPYQESAAKTDAMMAASRAARQTDARKRALSAGMMKNGGKVKKMASGGMTASSRGDGIASRGKTRGKIC